MLATNFTSSICRSPSYAQPCIPGHQFAGDWAKLLSVLWVAIFAAPVSAAAEKGRAVRAADATVTIVRPFTISPKAPTAKTPAVDTHFFARRTVIEKCPSLSAAVPSAAMCKLDLVELQ